MPLNDTEPQKIAREERQKKASDRAVLATAAMAEYRQDEQFQRTLTVKLREERLAREAEAAIPVEPEPKVKPKAKPRATRAVKKSTGR